MRTTKPAVSIIIVSWNVADRLVECLRSLSADCQETEAEVFVVDNASSDNGPQRVRQEFPGVRLIVNQENVGFSKANNLAIEHVSGDYVLLLNPDTVVLSGTLDSLVAFMRDRPEVGAVGCKQIYASGQWQPTCHRMITLKREALVALGLSRPLSNWIDYGNLPVTAREPFSVDWVGGACLMVRRDLLRLVGCLDDDIFLYAEDADLCHRIRQVGYAVYYLPQVKIVHHRGQSTSLLDQQPENPGTSSLIHQYRAKWYVIRKHFGGRRATLYRGVIVIELSRKLLQAIIRDLLFSLHRGGFRKRKLERNGYLTLLEMALSGSLTKY